jgi:predicted DNA-binding transcriptional regulator AlpA
MIDGLPGWPRGLSVVLAAAYVGLSPSTIRKLVDFPKPHALTTGRVVWLRDELDKWLDTKAGLAEAQDGWLK